MERTISFRKFRLGILVHLSRNPVFPGNFPFGKTKLVFPFTFQPKFPDFFVNGKQPETTFHCLHFLIDADQLLFWIAGSSTSKDKKNSTQINHRRVVDFFPDIFLAQSSLRKYLIYCARNLQSWVKLLGTVC